MPTDANPRAPSERPLAEQALDLDRGVLRLGLGRRYSADVPSHVNGARISRVHDALELLVLRSTHGAW